MSNQVRCSIQSAQFTRIEKVLEYIHHHLFLPLSLDEIAQKSCWSRWQLQRVFAAKTGMNVAQYIRELKLSRSAETLLDSPNEKVIDIALSFGFNSEISFSRSFKQFFGCSPRDYRKRGIRTGLRQPITMILNPFTDTVASEKQALASEREESAFTQIRIEHKPAFSITGCRGEIAGLFSSQPDFQQSVPQIWREFEAIKQSKTPVSKIVSARYGVIDTLSLHGDRLDYWAGEDSHMTSSERFNTLNIPSQEYAVLPHQGPIEGLKNKVEWLITHWLPRSGYRGIDGFELEIYSPNYQLNHADAYMEYWLPVE